MENSTASDQEGQSQTVSKTSVKKKLRWGWIILIGIPLLLALFHLEENWRARHAWERYKSELQATGRWIEYSQLIPPPIPDAENFVAIPLFTDLYISNSTYPSGRDWLKEMKGTKYFPSAALSTNGCVDFILSWRFAMGADVFPKIVKNHSRRGSEQPPASMPEAEGRRGRRGHELGPTNNPVLNIPTNQAVAAQELLKELSRYDPLLKQLEQAAQRPKARFSLNYSAVTAPDRNWDFPHYAALSHCCDLLALRACIHLNSGSLDDALQDVKLSIRLASSITNEPFLEGCCWMHQSLIRRPFLAIREGLSTHQWNESQLKEFQDLIRQQNQWQNFLTRLRAYSVYLTENLTPQEYYETVFWKFFDFIQPTEPDNPPLDIVKIILPKNWHLFEKLNLLKMLDNKIMSSVEFQQGVIHSRLFSQIFASGFLMGRTPPPTLIFRHQLWRYAYELNLRTALMQQAKNQSSLDSAMLACALERYRLQNGAYPDRLEALIPQFIDTLPPDPILGGSYKYRRDKPNHYILYSIGYNGVDDGGTIGKRNDVYAGDWVWSLPER